MKNSRMRTNTICDLIPNWNKVRKGVEEMDKHLELFGKELMIYSINKFDYGYIFQIGLSTYSDYIFNSKTPYKFSSDCHQLALEDNYTRSRENVIFQQGDISKMLDDKIAVWKVKKDVDEKSIGQNVNDKGKWLMYFELRGGGIINLHPILIKEYSQQNPYFISDGEHGHAITQQMRDSMEIYSFSKTDIERLKIRLEGLVEDKYRKYPNWNSPELERAKKLINEFCLTEYQREADFSDMSCIGVAYTTITDDEIPVQVNVNLIDYTLERYIDNILVEKREFDNIADLAMNQLEYLNFDDLISFDNAEFEKAGVTLENNTAETTSIMDKTMFMVGRGKYDYYTTIIPSVEEQIAEYIVTNPDKDLTICDGTGNVLITVQKGVITSCVDENYLNNTLQPAVNCFRENKDKIMKQRENIFQNVFRNNEAENDEEIEI